jgi:hypothetical protein
VTVHLRAIPSKKKSLQILKRRWKKRKEKFYNPEGICENCTLSTETMQNRYCKACLTYFRRRKEDDYL